MAWPPGEATADDYVGQPVRVQALLATGGLSARLRAVLCAALPGLEIRTLGSVDEPVVVAGHDSR